MPLILQGATSGQATVQATDAATVTMTLPATSGTLVVTGGAQTIEFADGSAAAPSITNSGDTNTGIFFPAADTIAFTEGGVESMRIDSSGQLGIGTTSPAALLHTVKSTSGISAAFDNGGQAITEIDLWNNGVQKSAWYYDNTNSIAYLFATTGASLGFSSNGTERMRILSNGNVLFNNTTASATSNMMYYAIDDANNGHLMVANTSATDNLALIYCNRQTSDGKLMEFRQNNNAEGTISVSGTTVSYNGGHLSRSSQLPSNQKDDTLLKGTVMSNLDDMCVWVKDDEELPNEQLNRMKVSDVEGDTNVAGVFVSWIYDEQCKSDDMNVAMTGDMIIRIAQGVVVQKGDLLMSAGDGTAKPQGDDIRRSKTVAKVTSNHVTCTYADGSYCVPCVLMAC